MQKFKSRIILLFICLILTLFFTSDFSLIDIQKTAIIIALGIDRNNEDFEITAQIAVPQATDQASNNNAATITSQGKTIYEAIDNISIESGWQPKLSFCDLVLLGQDLTKENVMPIIDYFVASKKLQNSAIIAYCDKKAKDFLTTSTPLDAISSFAIQKTLFKNPLKVNSVCDVDIRKFAFLTYSHSKTTFAPLIKMISTDDKSKQDASSSQTASTSDSSQSSSSSENKNNIFDATTTAIIRDGVVVETLNKDETLAFNLILKNVEESYINVEVDGENKLFSITKNKSKFSVQFLEKPTINVSLNIVVSKSDGNNQISQEEMANNSNILQKDLTAIENRFVELFTSIFEKTSTVNADIYDSKDYIYKYKYNRFKTLENLEMKNFDFVATSTAKSLD